MGSTLGRFLASIRNDRGMTLRQVEDATEKEVSNAYLSQIENGRIQNPSARVLLALAEAYGIDYGLLMEMAGYVQSKPKRKARQRHGRIAAFAEHNLTSEEETELLEYLRFIRNKKRHVDKT